MVYPGPGKKRVRCGCNRAEKYGAVRETMLRASGQIDDLKNRMDFYSMKKVGWFNIHPVSSNNWGQQR